jgi:AcrR family transcriptional regulator
MAGNIDRRAARTRRALQDALIALILRKGYEDITIQDLLDEADVGRSTFYAHFTGKEDLLRRGFERLRDHLASARTSEAAIEAHTARTLPFSLAVFEHVHEFRHVYRAMDNVRANAAVIEEIRRVLADFIREELPISREGAPRELVVQFTTGAFMNVLDWWLEREPRLSPSEIDAIFRRLVIDGIGGEVGSARRA